MRMATCVILVLLSLAQNPAKKPDGDSHNDQPQPNTNGPAPVTVNCNQSTGAIADHKEQKTPEGDTSVQWANWALVFIGGITALAVWYQAQKTAEATQAMRDSLPHQEAAAKAAFLNAQAVINAERPWVVVFYDGNKDGTFQFCAANNGRTPANIISFAVGFKCVSNASELPPAPDYGPEITPTTNLLMNGESEWGKTLVLMSSDDCETKMERCNPGPRGPLRIRISNEKLPVFYFRVKYRVVLANDESNAVLGETRACYSVSPFGQGISFCGGEAYNHYK